MHVCVDEVSSWVDHIKKIENLVKIIEKQKKKR